MPKSALVATFVVIAALAAGALWFLSSEAPPPAAPAANATEAAPAVAQAEQGKVGEPAVAPVAPDRTPAPIEPTAVPSGFAILGVVVDEQGRGVAGASIDCVGTPDFGRGGRRGGFDWANFDPADFDPAAMVEQLRQQQQDRVVATSDALGHFRVLAPGQGQQVFLRVSARSFERLDRQAERPTTADVDLGALALQQGAVVRGRVVDRQGAPIEGARVVRRSPQEARFDLQIEFPGADLLEQMRDGDGGVSDASGWFELPNVPAGKFGLRARHPDHPVAQVDGLEVAKGQALDGVVVVVEAGARITGRVVDVPADAKGLSVLASVRQAATPPAAGNGMDFAQLLGGARDMLADAGMAIGQKSVPIDADGAFELRGLEADQTYRLVVAQTARGFVGNGAVSEAVDVPAGSQGVELKFDPGITVTCRVIDAATKAPVERLWVSSRLQGGNRGGLQDLLGGMMPGGSRAKDYPDGRVTLTDLRPKGEQTLRLSIEAIGYAVAERTDVKLPASGSLDLGTIELQGVPVVKVQVIDQPSGKPVAGASVQLRQQRPGGRGGRGNRGGNGDPMAAAMDQFANLAGNFGGAGGTHSAKTGRDGRCVLNAVTGEAATLLVSEAEHAPWQGEVTPPQDKDLEQRVLLLVGGSVEVTVREADGKPIAKANVEHAPPVGSRGSEAADAEGLVVFEHLAPGAHRFRISERRGGGADLAALAAQFGGGRRGGAADEVGWQTVEVVDRTAAKLELAKAATATLRGIVRENGVALADARVQFVTGPGGEAAAQSREEMMAEAMAQMGGRGRGRSRSVTTGADGSYELKELPEGPHRLRVSHSGRTMPTTVDLVLRLGDNIVDVDLEATVLRGTVRDPAGKPVEGAAVSVQRAGEAASADPLAQLAQGLRGGGRRGGSGDGVTTGADGSYELRGVASGVPLVVAATKKGMARGVSSEVELTTGGSRDGVDVQLLAAGSIKVSMQGGGMMAAVQATLLGADGNPDPSTPPSIQALRRGTGVLENLRPGRWKVERMGMRGAEGEPQLVFVVAGETAELNF